jgi:hypothetical protein
MINRPSSAQAATSYERLTTLDAIADELGDLPLALTVAGSYLRHYIREVTPESPGLAYSRRRRRRAAVSSF